MNQGRLATFLSDASSDISEYLADDPDYGAVRGLTLLCPVGETRPDLLSAVCHIIQEGR